MTTGKETFKAAASLNYGTQRIREKLELGTCRPICGRPGHADNDKPHVRNESCWNWQPSMVLGTTLGTICGEQQ